MSFVQLVATDAEQVIDRFEAFHHRFSTRFATLTRTHGHPSHAISPWATQTVK